ncbi:hypothetical protein [Natronobeatus ordinarius]|uniref:hypothetical protein n=1 Tax=Natronobeatus ordinarius TaxID=2963433 RepID=UPI0020CFE3FA|nr:hypothetical protein [Natronobeatus ordinarius]
MSELSHTFNDWKDRLTYIVVEAQLLVVGVCVSIAVALLLIRPSLPGVPPVALGMLVSLMLFGPPLFGLFAVGAERLRQRDMVTVYHINGVTDEREKYYVAPELWDQKTVDGPSPYVCNDGDTYEVREFEYFEDLDELRVTGCYFSKITDSKLVTTKAMLEDVHDTFARAYLEYNRLRGRIKRMGLEIQADVINEEAEADERGQMAPKTAVAKRWEAAKKDVEQADMDDIQDADNYEETYIDEHAPKPVAPEPRLYDTVQAAETDGGTER